MLDFDLAELYETETRTLNQQVKRNISRFPNDFMFQLTSKELASMRSQIVISSGKRKKQYLPYAFTEHGVAMLASILKSERAVQMNIAIVRAFIALRQIALNYDKLAGEIHEIKQVLANHSEQLEDIYGVIENLLSERSEQNNFNNRQRIGYKE